MDIYFKDPDGDSLEYTITSDKPSVIYGRITSGIFSVLIYDSTENGTAKLTITADDKKGGTVTMTFNVTVNK